MTLSIEGIFAGNAGCLLPTDFGILSTVGFFETILRTWKRKIRGIFRKTESAGKMPALFI